MIAMPRSNPHCLRSIRCSTLGIHPCLIQSIQSRCRSSDSKSRSSTVNELVFFTDTSFFHMRFEAKQLQTAASHACSLHSRVNLMSMLTQHGMCLEKLRQRTFRLALIVITTPITTCVCCWSVHVDHQSCPRDALAADL